MSRTLTPRITTLKAFKAMSSTRLTGSPPGKAPARAMSWSCFVSFTRVDRSARSARRFRRRTSCALTSGESLVRESHLSCRRDVSFRRPRQQPPPPPPPPPGM